MVFLRWWFILSSMLVGCALSFHYGMFHALWNADQTHISYIALALFTIFTAFIGRLTKLAEDNESRVIKHPIAHHLPLCWFIAEALMGLGMLGTLAGFLLLLYSALGGGVSADPAVIQKMIGAMAIGFATAASATIVGLTCSLLIKLQLINLEYLVKEE